MIRNAKSKKVKNITDSPQILITEDKLCRRLNKHLPNYTHKRDIWSEFVSSLSLLIPLFTCEFHDLGTIKGEFLEALVFFIFVISAIRPIHNTYNYFKYGFTDVESIAKKISEKEED